MSRESFEKLFEVPESVYWCEEKHAYLARPVRGVGATAESLFAAHRLNWAWKGYKGQQREIDKLKKRISELEIQLEQIEAEIQYHADHFNTKHPQQ